MELAKDGLSTQISLAGTGTSDKAIDGNPSTFTHTSKIVNPWWEYKFRNGSTEVVVAVELYNRIGCCNNRLSYYDIMILQENRMIFCATTGKMDQTLQKRFNCTERTIGTGIKIQSSSEVTKERWFTIAEVEIYALK